MREQYVTDYSHGQACEFYATIYNNSDDRGAAGTSNLRSLGFAPGHEKAVMKKLS